VNNNNNNNNNNDDDDNDSEKWVLQMVARADKAVGFGPSVWCQRERFMLRVRILFLLDFAQ
jgi:hypothetical protein